MTAHDDFSRRRSRWAAAVALFLVAGAYWGVSRAQTLRRAKEA